jgi:AraC-like DNA-binding protein
LACVSFQFDPTSNAAGSDLSWQSALPKFREAVAREYYDGDVMIDTPAGATSVRIDSTSLGAVRVARFASAASTRTTRTWRHIRRDPCSIFLIWFVKHGSFSVMQNGRDAVVGPGEFAITSSRQPFQIATSPEFGGPHESYQVVVPQHVLAGLLPDVTTVCGQPYRIETGPSRLAQDVFLSLFANGEALPQDNARRLAEEALNAVALAVQPAAPTAVSARAGRRSVIYDHIEAHLGDPQMTAAAVAADCGISVRYLHLLMAEDGRRFHEHLWNARLARARDLLADQRSKALQIAEVAYLVGFKNPAHFSRAFRRVYACSPRQLRQDEGLAVQD